jgi:NADPH:quinone reductase-like Zn-dependent oxidoreductase
MKAIHQEGYGSPDVLQVRETQKPVPKDNEILIELEYANVSSGDAKIRSLQVPFIFKPVLKLIYGWKGLRRKIAGSAGAGTVIEVGKSVTTFQVGDKVYAINGMKLGYYAEFTTVKETGCVAKIPISMSTKEAAPLAFGALTAYHFTNQKNIKKGQKVLIYGASGSVGTYAIQFAKFYGAEVTAVSSQKNHPLLLELGVDHVIDYKIVDFRTQSKKYDVIFDAVGYIKKSTVKKVLTQDGKFLSVTAMTTEKQSLLLEINEIIKEAKIQSVISEEFTFERIQDAHTRVDSGRKIGNILLKIK